MERDVDKLRAIYDLGRESFGANESEIRAMFEKGAP